MKLASKKNIVEFVKYAIVGAVCAVIDVAVNSLMLYIVLDSDKSDTAMVIISVACGFVVGLLANFVLSNLFVFISDEQRKRGRTLKAFLIYSLVGVIGFILTEVLTVLGTYVISEESIWYIILNCIVKGLVLIWNYFGRKIFVYRGK